MGERESETERKSSGIHQIHSSLCIFNNHLESALNWNYALWWKSLNFYVRGKLICKCRLITCFYNIVLSKKMFVIRKCIKEPRKFLLFEFFISNFWKVNDEKKKSGNWSVLIRKIEKLNNTEIISEFEESWKRRSGIFDSRSCTFRKPFHWFTIFISLTRVLNAILC